MRNKLSNSIPNKFKRARRILAFFALCGLVISLPLAIYFARNTKTAEAGWWDDHWLFRKRITLANNGDETDNQYVSFTADTQTLITNGQLQSDCRDLRFTDINGHLLKHKLSGTTDNIRLNQDSNGDEEITQYVLYSGGQSVHTFSHTVSEGENQVLVVIAHGMRNNESGHDVTSVTYNGASLTPRVEGQQTGNTRTLRTEIWTLTDPKPGTYNITVTYVDATSRVVIEAMNFVNVNQDNPVGQTAQAAAAGVTSLALPMTTVQDDSLIVGGAMQRNNNSATITVDSPAIIKYQANSGSGNQEIGVGGGLLQTAASGSYSLNISSTAANNTHGAAIELRKTPGFGSACNAADTGFFVLLPTIFSGENNFYMYYGNPSATSVESSFTHERGTIAFLSSTNTTNSTSQTNITFNHTVADDIPNQMLMVIVQSISNQLIDDPFDVTGVTYDGDPLSLRFEYDSYLSSRNPVTSIWALPNPNPGTAQVSVTYGENVEAHVITALNFAHVDQAAIGSYAGNNPGGTTASTIDVNINTAFKNSLLLGGGLTRGDSGGTVAAVSPATTLSYASSGTADDDVHGAIGILSSMAPGTSTVGFARVGGGSDRLMNAAVIELRPSLKYSLFTPDSGPSLNTEEKTPGPNAWFKFDEGSDNQCPGGTNDACDSTAQKNDGTNTGAAWQTSCVFGACLLFDGSDDVVTIPNTNALDFDTGLKTGVSVSFWVNPSSDGEGDNGRIFTKGSRLWCRTDSQSGGTVDLECTIDLATTDATVNVAGGLTIGQWHHVEITYADDGDDDLLVYINGELRGTGNGSGAPASTDTNPLLIGGDTGTNYHGYLDDFKIFAYERTAAQVKTDYLKGAAAAGSNVVVGIGGTAMPDPIIWWRFDEMTGTTANNAAGASNNGTITSGAWTSNGKYEGALTFTASTSVTATITDPAYDNSLSLWVYPTTSAASKTLVTSGKLTTNGSSQPVYGGCTGTALPLDTWTHIVAVSNGSGSCTLYQNGIETITAGAGVTFGTSLNVGGTSFTGTMDDFKLYNIALTADQVKVGYNADSAINLGSGVNEQAALIDGDYQSSLVGYWPMDENTDTSTTANKAGSANGTLTSITESSWVPGKHGSALSLDGSADYVDIGTGPATVRSVSFWTHPVTTTEYFINLTSTTDYIWSSAGTLTATGLSSPTIYVNGVPSTTLTAGVWQHVAVVTATAENASNFDIGRTQNTNYLEGTIDDVKLFSSTLTQAQVAYEYNRGAPVAWWRLDECQGTAINDASGNGFAGTLNIGGSGTYTSPGTCDSGQSSHAWNTGTVGKFERSLGFDGTDDYVSVSDAAHLRFDSGSQDFSLFAWVKRNASGATHYIVSKEDADDDGYRLQFDSGNTVTCSIDAIDITSTTTITDTNWHHLGCVIDRDGDGQVYIDGLPDGSPAAISSEAMATTTALRFGSRSYSAESYLNGLLDDVRIYNYALSPEQVKSVITGGAVRFE